MLLLRLTSICWRNVFEKRNINQLFSSIKQRCFLGPMLLLPTLLSFGKCFRYSADMGRLLSTLVTSILMLWQLGNRGLCQGFRKMFNKIVNLTLSLFYYFRTWNNSHSNAMSHISSKCFTILFSVTQSNPTPIWYVQSKSWRDPHSLTSKHRHSQLHPETFPNDVSRPTDFSVFCYLYFMLWIILIYMSKQLENRNPTNIRHNTVKEYIYSWVENRTWDSRLRAPYPTH